MIRLTLFLFFGFSCSAWPGTDISSKAIELNRQGTEFLKKQNFGAAEQKYAEGLAASPYSNEFQVNLGLAFDGEGNVEKAKQAYELAAKNSKDPEVRFTANFNLGELAGRAKKVDEALSYYQKALIDQPDSKETKTNIELLTQNQNGDKGKDGDQKDQKDKDNKDKKNDQSKSDKDKKDKKDKDDQKDKDKKNGQDDPDKEKEKKDGFDKNKPQPKPFKSDQLSPGDVKKIMEELDRQEQRVRSEYNRKQVKEKPRDKDW